MENFAVFILTHGRPDNIITIETLKKAGYTGKIYLIIDDEDKKADKYFKKYGDMVIQFNKKEMADKVDEGNNFDERRTITHARNASFFIAKDLGLKYFIELDDDYTAFHYRYISDNKLAYEFIPNINIVFKAMIDFLENTPTLSIAMAQGGDFIGGCENPLVKYRIMHRKAMNSFMCSVDKFFQFIGTFNEDVNTYTTLGSRGNLFFTIPFASLVQKQTQSQEGGITDMYLRFGTFVKSFTTVMMMPSSVKVSMMHTSNSRIHHNINWQNTVPLIISEDYKKK